MLRTHTCGALTAEDVGKEVRLCGFVDTVRNLGSLVFVDLRDSYGITQLNIKPEDQEKWHLRSEDTIMAKGRVVLRSAPNKELKTGEIEIAVEDVTVFSESETTPFPIKDEITASEETRLEYRYWTFAAPRCFAILRREP